MWLAERNQTLNGLVAVAEALVVVEAMTAKIGDDTSRPSRQGS